MQQEGQPATVSVKSSGRQKQRVDHWTEDEEQRRLETYSVRDWAVNRERARMKAGSRNGLFAIQENFHRLFCEGTECKWGGRG